MEIYLAPMEGVTDYIYRRNFNKYFKGVDKYYTPFLSPTSDCVFSTREKKEIDPAHNQGLNVVPQIITNCSSNFIWAAREIQQLGYKEVNLNLGCPSGTVVSKKKGSGLLYFPEELDQVLYEIYDWAQGSGLLVSIKTRIGKADPEEFVEILDIYNKYPVSQLTIHPRIQSDFYKLPVRLEWFDYAVENSELHLVYNGDIFTLSDLQEKEQLYPDIEAFMLGRGLVGNPALLSGEPLDKKVLKEFLDTMLEEYCEVLSGEKPVLFRMKEFWSIMGDNFPEDKKAIKAIKKSQRICDYKSAVNQIL